MDPAYSSRLIVMMSIIKKNIAFLAFLVWAFFFFCGCSIPKIIVLKDPLTPEEYLRLGVSYERLNRLSLAQAQYQKAAAHDVPEAFLFLGNIAYQQNNYKDAETYYYKAIKKMPEDPRAYNNLAWLYYEQNSNDLLKAEHLARQALDLAAPDNRSAYLDTLEKILLARDRENTCPTKPSQ
jgi:tetratricopeptide (TPR) repeat protein